MSRRAFFFDVSNPKFLPLLAELVERGMTVQSSDPNVVAALKERGHAATNWLQFARPATAQAIRSGVDQVFAKINAILPDAAADAVFPRIDGRSFLRTEGANFVSDLANYVASQIDVIESFRALCAAEAPDIVVLGGDNSHRQRILIAACRERGIPTLHLMHATFAQTMQARYPANQTHLYADYVAAYGERAKTDLVALGYPPERVFCPGAPLWDHLYDLRGKFSPLAARREFGATDVEKPRLLFCACYAEPTSAFYALMTRRSMVMHQELARSLAHHGNALKVLIRPHPMDLRREGLPQAVIDARLNAYQAWLEQIGFVDVAVSFAPIEQDVLCADIVVGTNGSSSLPLARILERPVVAFRWYEDESRTFTEKDGVYLAERDCDLGFMIDELLRSPSLRARTQQQAEASLHENNTGHNGDGHRRVADLIMELMDQHRAVGQPDSVSSATGLVAT